MALFDKTSSVPYVNWDELVSNTAKPRNNVAAPWLYGADDWGLGGVMFDDAGLNDWLAANNKWRFGDPETGLLGAPNPGERPAPASPHGYAATLQRANNGDLERAKFFIDPKTGALTQGGDWAFHDNQSDSGLFGAIDKYLPAATTALLAYYGGQALSAAGGGTGAAGGVGAGSGATNPALIESAMNSAGYGASSAGAGLGAYESGAGLLGAAAANTNATNPALIDSALGTPGYGASSAGAGGGAGTGLFSGLASGMKNIGLPSISNLSDLAKVGGLLGAAGVAGQQKPADYNGPMPTITRGDWKPSVEAGSVPAGLLSTTSDAMLKNIPGQANSGLWRFLRG